MTMLTNPNQIQAFRIATLMKGIALEARGMKMSRGKSCLAIAKAELGLGRNARREDVLAQLQSRKEQLMAA
jgi:hypothetical protein